MPKVVIYTKPFCPYCARAENLLKNKGVAFEEIVASMDPERREEMRQRSGRMTYPQIFVGEHHVGGFDDLAALERDGKLDALLAAE
ncbi:MAG: glutaredoxin 3 [Caulobacterales bacterium]|nr:glutaredoxin 3 [Caulobacterales bacterium]